jgi:hypothetical protein
MVSVKIECPCGQHYAFDVEPVDGQMTASVACPTCGADGTAAANAIIAGNLPPAAKRPPVRVTVPTPSPSRPSLAETHAQTEPPPRVRVGARELGLVDRATAETEARAKISWGDSQDDVIKYLMLQGISAPEAQELVQVMFKERLAALRVKGIRKIVTGFGMMCVPVIAWGTFAHIGIISLKLMAITVMVGLYGCWELLNGILILVAPRMESGRDVAE